jgi:beta-lactamase class D
MEPSLFSDEDEWEAEMEDELADPFDGYLPRKEGAKTLEDVFKDTVDNFIESVTRRIAKEHNEHYRKKLDMLQKEIAIHQSEKASLADSIVAMEQHIRYLEQRLLGKE